MVSENVHQDEPAIEPLLWTEPQAARFLGICRKSLFNLAKSGAIPYVKINASKRYDQRDLIAYVERSKRTTLAPSPATQEANARIDDSMSDVASQTSTPALPAAQADRLHSFQRSR